MIWVLAPQPQYETSINTVLKISSHILALTYSITSVSSLQSLEDLWLLKFEKNAPKAFLALIANKSDLDLERIVDVSIGQEFAREIGAIVFEEVSAKTSNNVDKCFASITSRMFKTKVFLQDFRNSS